MIQDEFFDSVAGEIINHPVYLLMKNYLAHGTTSVYEHSLSVAIYAYQYARKKKYDLDYRSLIRGALLHDFYLYDWHEKCGGHRLHGFRHPFIALKNAKKYFVLCPKEENIILSHMFPLVFWIFPMSKEARIVVSIDKRCAMRETHKKGK